MPLQLSPLPAERFEEWRSAARQRVIDGNRASGHRIGADAVDFADALFAELLPDGLATPTVRILRIVDEHERELGTLWLAVGEHKLFLLELAVEEPLSDARNDDVLAQILAIARDRGVARISAPLFPHDTAGHALLEGRGFEVASIQMVLEPLPVREVPVHVDVAEVGILWLGMRVRDGRPHAFVLDIEVDTAERRKGYGRALMHAAEREARRLGADSIGLHVFGFNTGAIDLYEQLGYRRTEESLLREL